MADHVKHGDRAMYYRGCRCGRCTASNRVYQRGYRMHLRGERLDEFVRSRSGRDYEASTSRRRLAR